jgi:hypothetical protein
MSVAQDIIDTVVGAAAAAHREFWAAGSDVGAQTKRSHAVCRAWQEIVTATFPGRFVDEHCLNKTGRSHQIDLLDLHDRVAYELKASPNNVHMEIYRDVFKALVFNRRNPELAVHTLIFIAPAAGLKKLGEDFPKDVAAIAAQLNLKVVLRPI